MQVFAVCMECQRELGVPSFEPFIVPYYEDRISYIECSRGHKSAHVLQSQKFEVLLESGASALASGFTLEGCASFASALERLHEFGLKVFMINKGVTEESYVAMFKDMARQSERQLGAFLALYLTEMGQPFKPNAKMAEFRNAVIHKGQIPTPEEANLFCSNVYEQVLDITDQLRLKLPSALNQAVMLDLIERNKSIPQDVARATNSGGMFFSLASSSNKRTFTEALAEMEERKTKLLQSVPYMKAMHLLRQPIGANSRGRSAS